MKKVLFTAIVLTVLILAQGCAQTEYSGSSAAIEQKNTEQNQKILLKGQPPVKLKWSLERQNINKRTTLWNSENKIGYIYLVSFGKVMAFHTIKGKVSSVNSQITNPEQLIDDPNGSYDSGSRALPSPAEDGSYGSNGDAIFFFTTEGVYVEWAGEYMLCDQPLKLATPPVMVRSIK